MNKNILVVCPTYCDKRELSCDSVTAGYNIHFHDFDQSFKNRFMHNGMWLSQHFDLQQVLDQIVTHARTIDADGIIDSMDYPGSIFASLASNELGFMGPALQPLLTCHHKYFSRIAQQQYVSESVPQFMLFDQHSGVQSGSLFFPLFIKPVKTSFSAMVYRVEDKEQFEYVRPLVTLPHAFIKQFNWFLQRGNIDTNKTRGLLVERCLPGVQSTLEGFVHKGAITILGVTDSIMFPGTISFKRFEYPSSLPVEVQERMSVIARQFIHGIGFDNGFFNIEFMYDQEQDRIGIIEVNPRMAAQFADLYEKVDGTNSYRLLLDLSVGKKPTFTRRQGKHNFASSLVLRVFEDKRVITSPSEKHREQFYQKFPDGRLSLFVQSGDRLSDVEQDGKSFRYGLVHLGARDRQELLEKFELAKKVLPFEFESIDN